MIDRAERVLCHTRFDCNVFLKTIPVNQAHYYISLFIRFTDDPATM